MVKLGPQILLPNLVGVRTHEQTKSQYIKYAFKQPTDEILSGGSGREGSVMTMGHTCTFTGEILHFKAVSKFKSWCESIDLSISILYMEFIIII